MRIIGIDPGLVKTGWGIIDVVGSRYSYVAHGVVAPPTQASMANRLLFLYDNLSLVLGEFQPVEAAIEEIFLNTNAASTMKLGHARGVIILAPANQKIPVAEYAARLIKKSLVGAGAADKSQVAFMVRRILNSPKIKSTDVTDALAVAITHANHHGSGRIPAS